MRVLIFIRTLFEKIPKESELLEGVSVAWRQKAKFSGTQKRDCWLGFIRTGDDFKGILLREQNRELAVFSEVTQPLESLQGIFREKSSDKISTITQCVRILRDDFGVILADRKGVVASTDSLGRRPIYLYCSPSEGVAILSTSLKVVSVIMSLWGIKVETDPCGIARLLSTGVIPGTLTPFRHVERIRERELVMLDSGLRSSRISWQVSRDDSILPNQIISVDELRRLIITSLAEGSDLKDTTKVFVLLSGGTDSSIMCGILAKSLGNQNVSSLSVLIPGYNENDVERAAEIASFLGVKHRILSLGDEVSSSVLDEAFVATDNPNGGSAFLSRYLALAELKRYGEMTTRVAVGEGAGEVFLGFRSIWDKRARNLYSGLMYMNRMLGSRGSRLIYQACSAILGKAFDSGNISNVFYILRNSEIYNAKSWEEVLLYTYQFISASYIKSSLGISVPCPVDFHIKHLKSRGGGPNGLRIALVLNCVMTDFSSVLQFANYMNRRLLAPYLCDALLDVMIRDRTGSWLSPPPKKVLVTAAINSGILPVRLLRPLPKKFGLLQPYINPQNYEVSLTFCKDAVFSTRLLRGEKLRAELRRSLAPLTMAALRKSKYNYMKFNNILAVLGWFKELSRIGHELDKEGYGAISRL